MNKLYDMSTAFRKLEKDLLGKWEKTEKDGLCRMIDALPEQQHLKNKAVVRKYFPRQVKEIEDAEDRTIRKPTVIGGMGSNDEAKSDEVKYDSGCETNPKDKFWSMP